MFKTQNKSYSIFTLSLFLLNSAGTSFTVPSRFYYTEPEVTITFQATSPCAPPHQAPNPSIVRSELLMWRPEAATGSHGKVRAESKDAAVVHFSLKSFTFGFLFNHMQDPHRVLQYCWNEHHNNVDVNLKKGFVQMTFSAVLLHYTCIKCKEIATLKPHYEIKHIRGPKKSPIMTIMNELKGKRDFRCGKHFQTNLIYLYLHKIIIIAHIWISHFFIFKHTSSVFAKNIKQKLVQKLWELQSCMIEVLVSKQASRKTEPETAKPAEKALLETRLHVTQIRLQPNQQGLTSGADICYWKWELTCLGIPSEGPEKKQQQKFKISPKNTIFSELFPARHPARREKEIWKSWKENEDFRNVGAERL